MNKKRTVITTYKDTTLKTYKHLFEQLIEDDNLIKLAILDASKGKRHRKDVQEILDNIEEHIPIIKQMLIEGTFKAPKHKPKLINEHCSKKTRKIICPQFVYEHIIHHMVILVLEPLFRNRLYPLSCSSIATKGGLYGKIKLEKFLRKQHGKKLYVLKFDISKFFDSISRLLLESQLRKYIKDEKFMQLMHRIIFYNMSFTGIPIGFYTSQWLSNFYLTTFDFFITHKLGIDYYMRYADDCVLISNNKDKLHRALKSIRKFLKSLKLNIKNDWQIYRFSYINKEGKECGRFIDFMGFQFHCNRITLRKTILYRNRKRCNRVHDKQLKHKPITWYDGCQIVSQQGWFKNTNTYNYYVKYIKPKININLCKQLMARHIRRAVKNIYEVKVVFKYDNIRIS